ncbi:Hypothetical predicted protein [Olea europaea subsp. europaea]|uniref:DUF1985 domain-containing protein n=1 Tax=Olea europaea subsp. europaea TaxID=158383 RepID=A0A8S0TBU4_OLEEU|nr:Hypothetical predicted protein [Olea europaea subsp. europaea]
MTVQSLPQLDMDFEPFVPENARLWGHISQRSNIWYVKTVIKHFDKQQQAEFHNSCLGFLAELVLYYVQTDKRHKLWFNLQGYLARFSMQEYALVTTLRCGLLPADNAMDRVLEKRRLKDKYFKNMDKISFAQLEQIFLRLSTP